MLPWSLLAEVALSSDKIWRNTQLDDSTRLLALQDLIITQMHDDPDAAEELVQEQINFGAKTDRSRWEAVAALNQASIASIRGNRKQALEDAKRALALFSKLRDQQGQGDAYTAIGTIYLEMGILPEALDNFHRATVAYDEISDPRGLALTKLNLGRSFEAQQHDQLALEHYLESLQMIRAFAAVDESLELQVLGLLGQIYRKLGNSPKAIEYLEYAIRKGRDSGLGEGPMAKLEIAMGQVYEDQGAFSRAQSLYMSALISANKSKHDHIIAQCYTRLGSIFLVKGLLTEARTYCEKAQLVGDRLASLEVQKDACVCLYETHKKLGDTSLALSYFEQYVAARNMLGDEEQTVKLRMKHAEDLAETRIKRHEERFSRQSLERNKRQQLRFAAILAGLLSIIGFLAYRSSLRNNRRLARKNRELDDVNQKVKEQLADLIIQKAQLEKYIESNTQLEHFAGVAAHDLKAPLRTVNNFISLVEKSVKAKIGEREQRFFRYITSSVSDMNQLIEGLLSFSKINSENLKLEVVPMASVVAHVLENLSADLEENNAQIVVNDLPETEEIDRLKIAQVFQNLVANAIKFQEPGMQPLVEISGIIREHMVEFRVKDNGIGIEPRYHNKVFGAFERLHTRDKFEGSGIGLATCRKIVEKHGGKIWVEENQNERGSTFVFTLEGKHAKSNKPSSYKADSLSSEMARELLRNIWN